jgi:hypothetical protein
MRNSVRAAARRAEAASAALGARWCWFILKGSVLAVLLVRDGDLHNSLTNDLSSAVMFFILFGVSAILYIILTLGDPV